MRAGANTKSKAMQRALKKGCATPLCEPCGFAEKHVPTPWRYSQPGTPYPCDDPLIGEKVWLRGDTGPAEILGCATPVGPSLLQLDRVSKRRQCEGALVVDSPRWGRHAVTRSVVRERRRRKSKPGRKTCYCAGIPHPHREASSPLCEKHPDNLARLHELSRDAYEGRERDEVRFIESARRAAKRKVAAPVVETIEDANAVVAALDARQQENYFAALGRSVAPRSEFKKRVSAARKSARSQGWNV